MPGCKKKLISYHSNGVFDYDKLSSNITRKNHDPNEIELLDRLYHSGIYRIFNDHEAVIAYLHDDRACIP